MTTGRINQITIFEQSSSEHVITTQVREAQCKQLVLAKNCTILKTAFGSTEAPTPIEALCFRDL